MFLEGQNVTYLYFVCLLLYLDFTKARSVILFSSSPIASIFVSHMSSISCSTKKENAWMFSN